ncbi:hypothetical protein EXS54_02830 [Patescibacteria group bacterium]|nr:hypothetical protein [Patescibacteria group bacterium]
MKRRQIDNEYVSGFRELLEDIGPGDPLTEVETLYEILDGDEQQYGHNRHFDEVRLSLVVTLYELGEIDKGRSYHDAMKDPVVWLDTQWALHRIGHISFETFLNEGVRLALNETDHSVEGDIWETMKVYAGATRKSELANRFHALEQNARDGEHPEPPGTSSSDNFEPRIIGH